MSTVLDGWSHELASGRVKLAAYKLRVEPRLLLITTKVRLLLCDISPFVQPRAQERAVSSLDASDHAQCLNAAVEQYHLLDPSQSGGERRT